MGAKQVTSDLAQDKHHSSSRTLDKQGDVPHTEAP